jgi:hypothetical protein
MKKFLIAIIILTVLLTIAGLIESNYCHYLTTTPPPGASADYIKTSTLCKLNSLPGAIGGVIIIETIKDVVEFVR